VTQERHATGRRRAGLEPAEEEEETEKADDQWYQCLPRGPSVTGPSVGQCDHNAVTDVVDAPEATQSRGRCIATFAVANAKEK